MAAHECVAAREAAPLATSGRRPRSALTRTVPLILALRGLMPLSAEAQSALPAVSIVEDLRLDAEREDFPVVSSVFVGPRRQIVVPIAMDMQLRIYDSTGRRVAVVGRRGGGPGEFGSWGSMGWILDTLWISDYVQGRTTFVGPDRRTVRTERFLGGTVAGVARGGEIQSVRPLAILEGGRVLGRVMWTPLDERGAEREREEVFGLREADGQIRPVLHVPTGSAAPWWISTFACCRFRVPFALQPRYSIAHDGQYLAMLSALLPKQQDELFQVTVLRITGDSVFSRSYRYRAEPISRRERDSAIAVIVPAPGHFINVPPDLPERVRAEARERTPSWRVTVETILLGLDRTVWIGFRSTSEGRRYLILSSDGDPVGELLVPGSTRVQQASATRIWVTETDADGLSDVVRYRVSGLACRAERC